MLYNKVKSVRAAADSSSGRRISPFPVTVLILGVALLSSIRDNAFANSPSAERNPYEVLGVSSQLPLNEIEAVYRERAKEAHPDRLGGSTARMEALNLAMNEIRKLKRTAVSQAELAFESRRLNAEIKPYPLGMAVFNLTNDHLRAVSSLLRELEQSMKEQNFVRSQEILKGLRGFGLEYTEIAAIALARTYPAGTALSQRQLDFIELGMESRRFQHVLLTGYVESNTENEGSSTLQHGLIGRVPYRDPNLIQIVLRVLRKKIPEKIENQYVRLVDLVLNRLLETPDDFNQIYFDVLIRDYPELNALMFTKISRRYARNPKDKSLRSMFKHMFDTTESVPIYVAMDFITLLGNPWTFSQLKAVLLKTRRLKFEDFVKIRQWLGYDPALEFANAYLQILDTEEQRELSNDVKKGDILFSDERLQNALLSQIFERNPMLKNPSEDTKEETTTNLDLFLKNWRSIVANRLKLALRLRVEKTDYRAIAKATGLSQETLSRVRKGQANIALATGQKLSLYLNVRPEWLMAMDVLQARFDSKDTPPPTELKSLPANLRKIIKIALFTDLRDLAPNWEIATVCSLALTSVTDEALIQELKKRGIDHH